MSATMDKVLIFAVWSFGAVVAALLFSQLPTADSRIEKLQAALIETAKETVRHGLTDPYSAQFESVRLVGEPGAQMVCGLVNAKNKFGGYVGNTPFVVSAAGIAYILNDATAAFIAGEQIVKPCFPGLYVPKRK